MKTYVNFRSKGINNEELAFMVWDTNPRTRKMKGNVVQLNIKSEFSLNSGDRIVAGCINFDEKNIWFIP